ncbi:MAG TPA: ACT domain-containing protein [Ignavibacteriales bacterium]|nr:ACT domain-containing protein [Ignavibacteriales bacterium]
MRLSEDEIRQITLSAIEELGEKASPELVKKVVQKSVTKIETSGRTEKDQSTGRAILTAYGLNHPGVVSSITKALSENNCDIQDISQKIMQEFFTMIMLVDITNSSRDLKDIQDEMSKIANDLKIKIFMQHEDLFRFMHRI